MKDQLVFDTTDVNTIADSDKVGSHTLAGDGTLITSGDGNSDNVANTFEGLDMRSFLFGYDSVGDNWDRLSATNGILDVNVNSGSITITPESVHLEDDAHASGDEGSFNLSVRIDDLTADNSALLAGTNGDYQGTFTNDKGEMYVKDTDTASLLTDIDTVLDSIKVDTGNIATDVAAIETELLDQGTTLDSILSDTTGILADTANIDSILTALSKAEDSVHVSGDQGIMGLAVRNDAGTALAADGDYIPLSTDNTGAMYVNVANDISINDVALADTAIANAANTLAVASTAQDIVASPLASRKYLYVYNNDNRKMYVGATGVTEANGFPVSPGSYLELRAGASIDIEFVSNKANHAIRTLELS